MTLLLGHGHTASPDAIGALTFHGFSSIRLLLYATLLLVFHTAPAGCELSVLKLVTVDELHSAIWHLSETSSVTPMCKVLPTWLFKLCAGFSTGHSLTHLTKVISGCFAVWRQPYSIGRSVSRKSSIRLVVPLVLTHTTGSLQSCSCWIASIPARLPPMQQLTRSTKMTWHNHVTSLMKEHHWLRMSEGTEFQVTCTHG